MKTLANWVEINPKTTLEKGKTYTFVGMESITPHQRYVNTTEQRTFTGSGSKFQHLDTLFARITPCLENGKISQFIHKEKSVAFGSTEFFVFRAIPGKSIPSYVYYLTQTKEIQEIAIKSMVGTSGRQRADANVVREIPTELPVIEEQEKISATLSNYDDLIATNQRRITLLEEAAHLIYREWFVHLRFPGHDSTALNKNTPVTWQRKNLFEVCDVNYGYPFKSNHFNSASLGTPAVRIRDIPEISTSTFTTETVDESYTIERGDFLIGMDGIFHMNHWVGPKAYLVQRVCKVRPKDDKFLAYIGLALRDPIKIFETTIQGATVAHLGAKHLKQIEINVPVGLDEELGILNDLLWQQIHLREMNMQLAQARDLLLPKLMSGQIDVINIQLPDEDVVT